MPSSIKTPGTIERILRAESPEEVRKIVGEAGSTLQNQTVLFRINRAAAKRIKDLAKP